MNEWNLHFTKKFGLYQCSVDLYLWRWIKDAQWKFIFRKEVWIIPTCGGFVPMNMNKRWTNETYISRRSLDYTNARCMYLWRWIKDAEWKFSFRKEVWIIPTCGGFVPMKLNKRCTMEIYISQRSWDYTNAQWICTYEDK